MFREVFEGWVIEFRGRFEEEVRESYFYKVYVVFLVFGRCIG